jgi:hypothetical protein
MNVYKQLKDAQSAKFNDFPMFFAFDRKQFNEGLQKLNTTETQVLKIGGGGFIRASDLRDFQALIDDMSAELERRLSDPNFFYYAVRYELNNHEYSYTYDAGEALRALGLTFSDLTETQAAILSRAAREIQNEAYD